MLTFFENMLSKMFHNVSLNKTGSASTFNVRAVLFAAFTNIQT
jgi:hypothetical protein